MNEAQNKILCDLAVLFKEGERSSVTPFLRAVQARFNWISPEAMDLACDRFGASYPRVYEEASLSPEFCTEPRGETVIAVCRGLACSEAFAADVLKDWEKALNLKDGQTSPDNKNSLCTQNCFGRCAIGPNIKIGEQFYSGQKAGDAAGHLQRGDLA
jgi:NADH:ubiquinone oxidoreductase subunit E